MNTVFSTTDVHPHDAVYIPITRADMGAYLGLSAEAVSRAFRILKDRGAITFQDREHIVLKRLELEAIVAGRL